MIAIWDFPAITKNNCVASEQEQINCLCSFCLNSNSFSGLFRRKLFHCCWGHKRKLILGFIHGLQILVRNNEQKSADINLEKNQVCQRTLSKADTRYEWNTIKMKLTACTRSGKAWLRCTYRTREARIVLVNFRISMNSEITSPSIYTRKILCLTHTRSWLTYENLSPDVRP